MNKKLTNISWAETSGLFEHSFGDKPPSSPCTGETWIDSASGWELKIFDGVDWIEVNENGTNWIKNIGPEKANAMLDQIFMDEDVRDNYPAVMEAWKQYQFVLQMCYSSDKQERAKKNADIAKSDRRNETDTYGDNEEGC